jgi:hypothetical protein
MVVQGKIAFIGKTSKIHFPLSGEPGSQLVDLADDGLFGECVTAVDFRVVGQAGLF